MKNIENNILQLIRQEIEKEHDRLLNENKELQRRLDLVNHITQYGTTSVVEPKSVVTESPKTIYSSTLDVKTHIMLLKNKIEKYFKNTSKFDEFIKFVEEDNIVKANGCLVQAFKPHVISGNANAQCLLYAHSYRAAYNPKSKHMSGSFKSLARYINQKRLTYNEVKQYIPAFRM
jgi:hypothetical protein